MKMSQIISGPESYHFSNIFPKLDKSKTYIIADREKGITESLKYKIPKMNSFFVQRT